MSYFYKRFLKRGYCFYAPDGGGGSGGASQPDGPEKGGEDGAGKEPSFDELLENKAYRSEYDKRTKELIKSEKSKWEAEAKTKADEAARLAKMSEDEKAEHERAQKEKALADREAAVLKRELEAEAKAQLGEKGLPAELSALLDYADADACKASIETVAKAFGEAVEKKVNDRLRGAPPKHGEKNRAGDPFLSGLGIN